MIKYIFIFCVFVSSNLFAQNYAPALESYQVQGKMTGQYAYSINDKIYRYENSNVKIVTNDLGVAVAYMDPQSGYTHTPFFHPQTESKSCYINKRDGCAIHIYYDENNDINMIVYTDKYKKIIFKKQ